MQHGKLSPVVFWVKTSETTDHGIFAGVTAGRMDARVEER